MRAIEKHSLWLRVHHWLNVPLLALMVWSGILIYWANDVYPGFFPEWFYSAFSLRSRLAEGLSVHFLVGWLFVFNGIGYLIYMFTSGHWRELAPTLSTLKALPATILHDLGLTSEAPPQGKFNAAQKIAYTGVIGLGLVAVMTGMAIYKPVQLSWLLALFYSYSVARLIHFAVMIAFVLFFAMHIVQVMRAGWNGFRAMIAGFEVNDERE